MLKSKTITSKVFPLLEGLPEKVIEDIKVKENDKAFLFEPSKSIMDTESKYYCLACGRHGTKNDSEPVCPHCGNHQSRPFRTDEYGMHEALIYRYVHTVGDGYLFIREFACTPKEDAENGITVDPRETTRICIKDGEMITFLGERRYVGGVTESYWRKRDSIFNWRNNEVHLISTVETEHDPVLSKVSQFLTKPMSKLFDELKLTVAGSQSKDVNGLPNVSFSSVDYPSEPVKANWKAHSIDTPVDHTDGFVYRHSWCTNCGKYHMKMVALNRYHSSYESLCLKCGNSSYNRALPYVLVDAKSLDDGQIVLRVTCGEKILDFGAPTVLAQDPVVEEKYKTIFTNYILIAPNGDISFFNGDKQSIEKLQVQLYQQRRFKEYYYTTAKLWKSSSPATDPPVRATVATRTGRINIFVTERAGGGKNCTSARRLSATICQRLRAITVFEKLTGNLPTCVQSYLQ